MSSIHSSFVCPHLKNIAARQSCLAVQTVVRNRQEVAHFLNIFGQNKICFYCALSRNILPLHLEIEPWISQGITKTQFYYPKFYCSLLILLRSLSLINLWWLSGIRETRKSIGVTLSVAQNSNIFLDQIRNAYSLMYQFSGHSSVPLSPSSYVFHTWKLITPFDPKN